MVAKVVPQVIIRIVTGTHSVDIEFLHDLNILDHAFGRYDITTIRINFMTVGTFEENGLAVY